MKSIKSEKDIKIQKFPKLQIKSNGDIFLMCTTFCGTLIYSLTDPDNVGDAYSDLELSNLVDFNGSITLEN